MNRSWSSIQSLHPTSLCLIQTPSLSILYCDTAGERKAKLLDDRQASKKKRERDEDE